MVEAAIHRSKRNRGWTLIELLIVVVLLAILAIVVAPRFGGSGGYHEHVYQARLISALRTMQQRAMNDTRPGFCFQINIKAGADSAFGPPTLDYTDDTPLGKVATCNAINITTDVNEEYVSTTGSEMADNGIQITGSDRKVEFDNMGCTVDSGASCFFSYRVEIQGQRNLAVCVEPQGYVHACD